MDLILRVVRFIIVTVIIGLIVRIAMALLGIDKKLDGKNKHWDKYRKQEAKALVVTGKYLRKAGESLKTLTKDLKEEVVKTKEVKEKEFCIQDDTWPSRKWNKEHTDYIDLSGCTEEKSNHKKEEEDKIPAYIVNGICRKAEHVICNIGYACDGCPYLSPEGIAQIDAQIKKEEEENNA